MRLLLVNPNTSAHITDRMVAAARAALGGDAEIVGATARFGPAVIGTRAEAAIAAHAALDELGGDGHYYCSVSSAILLTLILSHFHPPLC